MEGGLTSGVTAVRERQRPLQKLTCTPGREQGPLVMLRSSVKSLHMEDGSSARRGGEAEL